MNSLDKLQELIKDIEFAFLTTVESDGTLRGRPMATQKSDRSGYLWFFTKIHSAKIDEINRESHVHLSYSQPGENRYVSVSGRAQVVRDQARIDELWSPALKAWFPEGKADPEIALLRVTIDQAEYWDAPSSTMVKIAGFVKALATGQEYHPGENEKLDFDKESAA